MPNDFLPASLLAEPPPRRRLARSALLVLGVGGLLLRLPLWSLPLGDGPALLASLGTYGDHLQDATGGAQAAFMPWLLGALAQTGLSPAFALRLVEVLLGAAFAPLVAVAGWHFGLGPRRALVAGLLVLVHPQVAIHLGGAGLGRDALMLVALWAGLVLLLRGGVARSRIAGVLASVVVGAHTAGALYALPLLAGHAAREPSRRMRLAVPSLAVLVLVFVPGTLLQAASGSTPLVGGARWHWVLLVTCGVLLPALPFAGRVLGVLSRDARIVWHLTALAACAHGVLVLLGREGLGPGGAWTAAWGITGAGVAIVPVAALAGVAGAERFGRTGARVMRLGSLGMALTYTIAAMLPGQPGLPPASAGEVPRPAWHLGLAVDVLDEITAPGDLVAIDLPSSTALRARLADLLPDRQVRGWPGAPIGGDQPPWALPRLEPASARTTPALYVLVERGSRGDRETLVGAQGVARHEVVKTVGPFVVLRTRID